MNQALSRLDTLQPKHVALVLVVCCLAWGGVAWGSFQYDDFANVLLDPATSNLTALLDRLAGGIRPLTRISYALSSLGASEWAGSWLLINLSLHAITTLTIAALVVRRTQSATTALLAALAFAVLPSHAAVVAYVTGRSIGLATCLMMLALLSHEIGVTSGRKSGGVAAVVLFVLACAARETALIFPILVLVWEATRDAAPRRNVLLRRTAPYGIAGGIMLAVFIAAVPRYSQLLEFSFALRSPLHSLLQNLGALPISLSLLVRPWALSVEHAAELASLEILAGAAMLAVMLAVAIGSRRRHPWLTFGLIWPLIAMLPTHSLIARLDPIAEGPLYLAAIGPVIAASRYAARWLRDSHRTATVVLGTVLLGGLLGGSVLCMWRTSVWGNQVQLWQEATVSAPHSARAWTNLGMAYTTANDAVAARAAYLHALQLDPANVRAMINLETLAAIADTQPAALLSSGITP